MISTRMEPDVSQPKIGIRTQCMNQLASAVRSDHAALASLSFPELLVAVEATRLADESLIEVYRAWITAHGPQLPGTAAAWFNLGVAFSRLRQSDHAIACYEAALALRPGFYEAAQNLGLQLESQGRPDAALAVWQQTLQPIAAQTALLNHSGRLSERLGRLHDAENLFRRSLLLDPEQPDVIQHFVHVRQRLCLWPVLERHLPGLAPETLRRHAGPLATLALTDDVAWQCSVCADWIARKTRPEAPLLRPAEPYRHDRLRVGYLSSDFCRHAMSYLIAELLERHDRSKFKIYGYCSTLDDGSDVRARILGAFDEVRFVRDLTDAQAAQRIRDDEIDILIDLNGLTLGARLQVLRHRPAPIQATYLGFIGPVPLPELDYLLSDAFVIPDAQAAQYAPRPLAIGPLYQANDSRREMAAPTSRREVGLPEDRFVFCCFSNHYKITPEMFEGWMQILRQVDHGVLWLADDGSGSDLALRAHAAAAGVAPDRLIFTGRVSPGAYLARLRLADLFLDTFPYNAGTVASDAIRMGVPMVTLSGRSFASRMAASLLHSIGAQAGVAETQADYVRIAVTLATDPPALAEFARCFTAERWHAGPGNMERFTHDFEQRLLSIQAPLAAS
jgi:predicted O-linked N-acetylglucosamine transferase (SPINDLY family)